MKVPVDILTADARLHRASLHLPFLEMGWQRTVGIAHLYSHHGTSDHGAFARPFPSEEFKALGMRSEVKPWRRAANWGPPGWDSHHPSIQLHWLGIVT